MSSARQTNAFLIKYLRIWQYKRFELCDLTHRVALNGKIAWFISFISPEDILMAEIKSESES
jgi:hypothetical protein